jgi:hypothetical protein
MQAYNNNPTFREQVLNEIKRHEELDMFQKGIYGETNNNDFKGCAIGCTIHSLNLINHTTLGYNSHEHVAKILDVDVELCYLIDRIFEGLPTENAKTFTYRIWSAIRTGADTSDVCRAVKIWILQQTLKTIEHNTYEKIDDVRRVIHEVIYALQQKIPAAANARAAADDDDDAAYAAARAAADAAYAAYAAARAAAVATAADARAAAYAAARAAADARAAAVAADAARAGFYNELSEFLIAELEKC